MGALIILHGLFLLHCNTTTKAVNGLDPQTCEILSADADGHAYRVGANKLVPLKFSANLTVNLPDSTNKDPSAGLESKMMVLNREVVTVATDAKLRIVLPLPDNIYGANVLKVLRNEVLTTTDPTALLSPDDGHGRIALAESIVLSYTKGAPFGLYDSGKAVAGAGSATIGGNNVLAFFAWPAQSGMNCATPMNHAPLNNLLQVGGKPTAFQLMGLVGPDLVDDPHVSGFSLPPSILRPPCVKDSSAILSNGGHDGRTATQTGCGPMVHI
jgi:hypothetical protein